MANTAGSRSDFVSAQRQAVTLFLSAVDALNAQRSTWDAGMNTWLEDDDFCDNNVGVTKAQVTAVFTTLEAVNTLLSQGHRLNLELVRR